MSCGLCHTTRPRYEYKPLDPETNEIRLLRASPAPFPSPWTKTLRFNVETVQLSNVDTIPSYYAISYVWGPNVRRSKVYLDGQVLVIPHGAERALRGVLKGIRAATLKPLPLWIDAVCIDQHDTKSEKAHQVNMMGDIYSRAESVLIWLGPDDGSAARSMRACQVIADECKKWTDDGRLMEHNESLPARERQALPYMRLPPPPGQQLEGFCSLLKYRWFSRMWVVQEVVLSRKAIFLCGRHHLPWESFAHATRWIRHRTGLWTADSVSDEDFQTLAKVNKIIRLKSGHEDMTMEALLTQAFRFQCTNPLDKVYGLLGMVRAGRDDLEPIVPDYAKSVKEVYTQATWFAFKQELSLDLLNNITPSKDEELDGTLPAVNDPWPSWVPRYDVDKQKSTRAANSSGTNASNDFEAIVSVNPHLPFILQVHGVSLGRIETIRRASPEVIHTNVFEDQGPIYRHFSYLWAPNLTWSPSRIKNLAVSLVSGRYNRDKDNPYQDAESQPETVVDFAAFMLGVKEHCADIAENAELCRLLEDYALKDGDATSYATSVSYYAGKFAHFELPNARFGMGYNSCQEGDEVCILFGARQPFVMRKVGEHHRLLGTVYVAGVMKGEYVQQLEDEGRLMEEDRIYEIA
ncbi:hypothetical protein PRZ48_013201 [Zasmidium cellare]|uniref:Heterokaryon incompatibility domain-containing protein n=1 Tax=Zasmidium cellare TaxID=395010 RepID=A0ABR0E3C8_ZASCE|nr:hypothetical protein PRZ48_013201 [Zasmidium cellare]